MQARALFLDRDGVININHGYVYQQSNFDFIDGIFDLARVAHLQHYNIVVVTNQAGIGRGYYSEQQFHEIANWMCDKFNEQGAPIAKVYFSPYHPTEGIGDYKLDDLSRKPHPGMIFQAQKDLNLDLNQSILVGDKSSDIQAGIAAGIKCNILFGPIIPKDLMIDSCHLVQSLTKVIPFLTSNRLGESLQ